MEFIQNRDLLVLLLNDKYKNFGNYHWSGKAINHKGHKVNHKELKVKFLCDLCAFFARFAVNGFLLNYYKLVVKTAFWLYFCHIDPVP